MIVLNVCMLVALTLPVGKKIFTLKCKQSDEEQIKAKSCRLNSFVNKCSLQYSNLSPDNLMLVAMMQLLDEMDKVSAQSKDKQKDDVPDAIVCKIDEIISKITTIQAMMQKI